MRQENPAARIAGRPALICLILALASLLIYEPLIHAQFVGYDDPDYITANTHVLGGLTAQNIRWAFTTGHAGNWHPLTWMSHMLDCDLFGPNPGAHHLVNILFHTASTVLLFLWLMSATGAKWRSAFIAGLFALHPLHVQSVAWISERKDVLAAFFWMLATWSYVRYAKEGKRLYYITTLLLFIPGLLSKPMMVSFPFAMLLLDYWPLRRLETTRATKLVIEKFPLFALSIASCIITLAVQGMTAMDSLAVTPLPLRLANSVIAAVAYIGQMLCPVRLAVIYPYNLHPPVVQIASTLVALLLISIYALVLARRFPYFICGWLWFLGTLVPVIGVVQVGAQAMADRYTYIPLIGLFIAITWGVNDLLNNRNIHAAVKASLAAVVLAACSWVTRMQLPYWHDSITLFTHAIDVTSNNSIAHINLGVALANEKRFDEAAAHYAMALKSDPNSPQAWNNLGLAMAATGHLSEAINSYISAIQLSYGYSDAHNNLATALAQSGRLDDAITEYNEALKINPNNPGAENNLGIILGQAKRYKEAAAHFARALQLDPGAPNIHFNFANLLVVLNKGEEAVAQYSEAIRLAPDFNQARCRMAPLLLVMNRAEEAKAQYMEALKINPNEIPALGGLAWVYGAAPEPNLRNGPEAVKLAERACELTGYKNSDALDTLGVAYAETGRFADAIRVAKQGLEIATAAKSIEKANAIQGRIGFYQLNQPFHMQGGRR